MRFTPGRTTFFVGLIFAPFFACFEEPGARNAVEAQDVVAKAATLRGVVVDRTTKLPVKGAVISTVPATLDVVTDDEGRFRLAQALEADGQYTMIATAAGYDDVEVAFAAAPGEVLVVPVALSKAPEVEGEAVTSLTNTP